MVLRQQLVEDIHSACEKCWAFVKRKSSDGDDFAFHIDEHRV
jgi:hypothetical protein